MHQPGKDHLWYRMHALIPFDMAWLCGSLTLVGQIETYIYFINETDSWILEYPCMHASLFALQAVRILDRPASECPCPTNATRRKKMCTISIKKIKCKRKFTSWQHSASEGQGNRLHISNKKMNNQNMPSTGNDHLITEPATAATPYPEWATSLYLSARVCPT